jgi:peptidoglycan LD-endopeptidase LytH
VEVVAGSLFPLASHFGNPSPQNTEKGAEPVSVADYTILSKRNLAIPVPGVGRRDILDTFNEVRGTRRHEATDILAPKGTPVIAVDAGSVKKLFFSIRGGVTVYQFDSTETYCYYYAHLERYAEGLHEGESLKQGDRIGNVGTSGNARSDNPHLHFASTERIPV